MCIPVSSDGIRLGELGLVMHIGPVFVSVWAVAAIVRNVNVNVLSQLPHIVYVDITPLLDVLPVFA